MQREYCKEMYLCQKLLHGLFTLARLAQKITVDARSGSVRMTLVEPRRCKCGRGPAHRTRLRDKYGIPMCTAAAKGGGPKRGVGKEKDLRGTPKRVQRIGTADREPEESDIRLSGAEELDKLTT